MNGNEVVLASQSELTNEKLQSLRIIADSPELLAEYVRNYNMIVDSDEYEFNLIQKEQLARYQTLLNTLYMEILHDNDHYVYDATYVSKDGATSTSKRLHPKAKLVELVTLMENNVTEMLKTAKKERPVGPSDTEALRLIEQMQRMKDATIDAEFKEVKNG